MVKERVDILLVNRNLAETREKAKRLIMAGLVFSENERMDKPGAKIDITRPLTVKGTIPYVSRGGFKLERALDIFDVNVNNKIIVDIGASTGGFSDCALQNGAAYIYAVDVGYNQLAWKLRNDPRISVHERTNFRYVTKELFDKGLPNFAMTDVSFISLKLIFPVIKTIIKPGSDIIALVKPQFEARKDLVGKKGVIRNPETHIAVLHTVISFIIQKGFVFSNLSYSPITGGEGNIEFLVHFAWKKPDQAQCGLHIIPKVVEEAHMHFDR